MSMEAFVSFSYLERVIDSQREASDMNMGYPGEEYVGFCFPIVVHCGYFTPRGSSGEVLQLGLNREMLVKLVAAVALK